MLGSGPSVGICSSLACITTCCDCSCSSCWYSLANFSKWGWLDVLFRGPRGSTWEFASSVICFSCHLFTLITTTDRCVCLNDGMSPGLMSRTCHEWCMERTPAYTRHLSLRCTQPSCRNSELYEWCSLRGATTSRLCFGPTLQTPSVDSSI